MAGRVVPNDGGCRPHALACTCTCLEHGLNGHPHLHRFCTCTSLFLLHTPLVHVVSRRFHSWGRGGAWDWRCWPGLLGLRRCVGWAPGCCIGGWFRKFSCFWEPWGSFCVWALDCWTHAGRQPGDVGSKQGRCGQGRVMPRGLMFMHIFSQPAPAFLPMRRGREWLSHRPGRQRGTGRRGQQQQRS